MGGDRNQRRKKSLPPFLRVPHKLFDCAAWADLSSSAVRVYLCFRRAENGHNADSLKVSYAYFQRHGCGSSATISRSLKELVAAELIEIVTPGGLFNRCTVYRLSKTWEARVTTSFSKAARFKSESCGPENTAPPLQNIKKLKPLAVGVNFKN